MGNMTIQNDAVVTLAYSVKLNNGQVIDEAANEDPMQYLHGYENIIPGLEAALTGLQAGAKLQVVVAPEDAYGERIDDAEEWFEREEFPADIELEPGMVFQVEDEDGNFAPIFIKEVQEDSVLVDFNHPLAGETLHFDVAVLGVRPATEHELEHGHVHTGQHRHH